jgi:hypothetical protein
MWLLFLWSSLRSDDAPSARCPVLVRHSSKLPHSGDMGDSLGPKGSAIGSSLHSLMSQRAAPTVQPLSRHRGRHSTLRFVNAAWIAIVVTGCGQEVGVPKPAGSKWWATPVVAVCPPLKDPADQFPKSALSDSEIRDATHRQLLGKYGSAAELDRLWCGRNTPTEAYRLFWVPSYRAALVVDVRHDNGKFRVQVIEFADPREARSDPDNRFKVASRRTIEADEDMDLFSRASALESHLVNLEGD